MVTTTESAVLRATQARCLQLSESISLDWGVAYTSDRFRDFGEANQIREVVIDPAECIPAAFEAVEGHYSALGLTCLRWAPAADQGTDELDRFLVSRGFEREEFTAMAVAEWVEYPEDKSVRVLPARAMPKALGVILREASMREGGTGSDPACTQKGSDPGPKAGVGVSPVEAAIERLDDPQTETTVAMVQDRPVGCCSFFEVGDIGLVTDFFVEEQFRDGVVGQLLVGHVLKLSRRLQKRVTCLRVGSDDAWAISIFQRCGLHADGKLTEFARYVPPGGIDD